MTSYFLRRGISNVIMLPLAVLFRIVVSVRRWCYLKGLFVSHSFKPCVIVVGNIFVGGSGKTPLVLALHRLLTQAGWSVGVVSRGYGGRCSHFPHRVTAQDTAEWVGDEPAMIYARTQGLVVIDPNRVRGTQTLVDDGVDIVLADDGLQHYALKRDIECLVRDTRAEGNGWLIPAGPLREPITRLGEVDFVVTNLGLATMTKKQPYLECFTDQQLHDKNSGKPVFYDTELTAGALVNLVTGERKSLVNAAAMIDEHWIAIAGIGDPRKFFLSLERLGWRTGEQIPFADHHQFTASDLPFEHVIMTEKDAVKCRAFGKAGWWYLEVDLKVCQRLTDRLIQQVKMKQQQVSVQ